MKIILLLFSSIYFTFSSTAGRHYACEGLTLPSSPRDRITTLTERRAAFFAAREKTVDTPTYDQHTQQATLAERILFLEEMRLQHVRHRESSGTDEFYALHTRIIERVETTLKDLYPKMRE